MQEKNTAMYVHMGGGSNAYSRIRMAGLVYMAGSEWRNSVIVVFMGSQQNVSCSWGGNGMRHVHREATKHVGANRLGRNRMCGRVHREGLDGTAMEMKPGVPQNKGNGPSTFGTGSC